MRHVIFGRHDAAAGVFVESVDNAWSLLAPDSRKLFAVMQESIDQCPVPVASGRMDNHPGRLVDDYKILVFKEHLQSDVFGLGVDGHGRGGLERDRIGGTQFRVRLGCSSIEGDMSRLDQVLDARTRKRGNFRRQKLV